MKVEAEQIQTSRVQRSSRSITREPEHRSDILMRPKSRVWSMVRECVQITVLCFLGFVHMTCDAQPHGTLQVVNSPTSDAEIVDSSPVTGSDPNPTHLEDNGTRLEDNSLITDEWPTDVPAYPGLKVVYLANMKGTTSIQATADDAHGKVAAFYQTNAAETGWTEETTITEKQMVLLNFVKTKRKLSIVIAEREGGATISLTLIDG